MRFFWLISLFVFTMIFHETSFAFEERECWPMENIGPYLRNNGWEKLASGYNQSSVDVSIYYNKESKEIVVFETLGEFPNYKLCVRYLLEDVDKKWGLFD